MQRLQAEGSPSYCFKAHEFSKSLPLITMNTRLGHLHIVSPHNLLSVGWMTCTEVLKVVEWYSSLHEINIGSLPLAL